MIRKPSGNLIIAGQTFHIDAPVINFREPPYWDATKEYCIPTDTDPSPLCKPGGIPYGQASQRPRRYAFRGPLIRYGDKPPIEAVKAVIKQFVVHHDGCSSADMCFAVLQNERGLSCHFLIDNDGTIYQTIDLAYMAFHAAAWNTASIGVEFCNRGDAKKEPDYYSSGRRGPVRDVKPCKINGHTILSFDYTPLQYENFIKLARALQRLLPNLPAEFPQSSAGVQSWDTMPTTASFGFSGYIGHYHLTNQKWDPGPFDFKEFCRKVRGAYCFPLFTGTPKPDEDRPRIPEKAEDVRAKADELFKVNEAKADGGFFPVGPWGESRLWHGGVHLTATKDAPVFAPFPGRLVAARMGPTSPIGSMNFVLLRHDMGFAKSRVQFYSLYMHLADATRAATPVEWLTKSEKWKTEGKPGQVARLDEPIEAGAVIGHVGTVGPDDLSRAQIHVEFFSTSELFTDLPSSPWMLVDGTAGGRFCNVAQVNDVIDENKDGVLSRQELSQFYAAGNGSQMHYLIALHVSEWTSDPSWAEALRVPKDFKDMKPAEIDAIVAEQITPGLWWDAKIAAHCKLPTDGVVYHYHPVTFLRWFNEQLLEAAKNAAPGVNASDAQEVPKGITDDFGDVDGSSMLSSEDISEDPCNQKLTLQELVQGYDAPECTQ